jgi:hypothetical protein
MKKRFTQMLGLLGMIVTGLFTLNILFISNSQANEGIPNSPDAMQIQEVIKKSYMIEAEAAKTFDTTSFHSVFVNDSRGGELSASTVKFISSVLKNHSWEKFGYLDYKLAYFAWWEKGALRIEMLQSRASQENRSLNQAEMLSLIDEDGRVAMPRSRAMRVSTDFTFNDIKIESDMAIVVFDHGPRTNQMTLVKIEDQWFIAGNKILSVHP